MRLTDIGVFRSVLSVLPSPKAMAKLTTSRRIKVAALAAGVLFSVVAPAKAQIAPTVDNGKRVYVNVYSPVRRHGSTISSPAAA
jgi:hypothetical protein